MEMGGARSAGRQTDAEFAGELGMGDGHEGRHLLVANLDEFNLARPLQGSDHAVDTVTWISIDSANSPRMQSLDYEITDFHWKAPEIREVRFDRYNHRPAVVFQTT